MPRFMIEREVPGAGGLSQEELMGMSQTSCDVLRDLGPKIQWEHSYVSGDKICCVYLSESEDLIREHAERAGFPANRITRIVRRIDPTTAEAEVPVA